MVVKIGKATPTCATAVEYNESKVNQGKASVVYSQGIDDPSNPMATFEIYERASRRCQNPSFHMSINPSVTDKMTEEQVIAFAKDLMAGLGYGDQPVIIYKHFDIDRVHYHVVSVRVDKNGKKIKDSNEHRRCLSLTKKLAQKYGFVVGKMEDKKYVADMTKEDLENWISKNHPTYYLDEAAILRDPRITYLRFDPDTGNYIQQIESIVKQALTYQFSDIKQFQTLMRHFGIDIEIHRRHNKLYLTYYGRDSKTHKRCTPAFLSKTLDAPGLEEIRDHFEKKDSPALSKDVEALTEKVLKAFEYGKSEKDVRKYLAWQNVSLVLNREKNGTISDATFIDHQKHLVVSGNLDGLSLDDLEKIRTTVWNEPTIMAEQTLRATLEELTEEALDAIGYSKSRQNEDEKYAPQIKKPGPRKA